jgi:hypothetical protein
MLAFYCATSISRKCFKTPHVFGLKTMEWILLETLNTITAIYRNNNVNMSSIINGIEGGTRKY